MGGYCDMSKQKTPDSPPDSRSALEYRCQEVDGMIMDALESAAVSGDFDGVRGAMEAALGVLDAQLVLRVVTPCQSPCLSPSDESDPGFLPVNPGAGPNEESDSEGGYVS